MTTPTLSQYDQQAADFLAKYGIKCRITLSNTKTPQWDGETKGERNHYRVTLSHTKACYEGQGRSPAYASRLVFDFWGSIADVQCSRCQGTGKIKDPNQSPQTHWERDNGNMNAPRKVTCTTCKGTGKRPDPQHPGAYSVLACVLSDSHCPDTFADFCGEYGYDVDSIKAEQTFKRCSSFAKRIRAFFTAQELESLSEIN